MLHRRYFSLRDISKSDIEASIEQANLHHPTIKFTAETSDNETVFLDTVVYKGTRKNLSLMQRHMYILNKRYLPVHRQKRICQRRSLENPTKTLLRIETTFEENNSNFKKRLIERGYPQLS